MSGDDLIVAVPWLVFAAGLAMMGWRLAAGGGAAVSAATAERDDPAGIPGPALGQPTGTPLADRRPCRHRRGLAWLAPAVQNAR